jgi:hypothetical protein
MLSFALSLRFLMLFASFGAMVGGLMMFWAAGTKLARGFEVLFAGVSETSRKRLPAWMHIQGVAELKVTLVQVILVYLTVDFATDISEPGDRLSWETLVMPIAILLLSGALVLMSWSQGRRETSDP